MYFIVKCIFVILTNLLIIVPVRVLAQENDDIDDNELELLLNKKVSKNNLYNQKITETPNSIIIISSNDIQLYGYQSVSELISTLQGIYTRNDLNYEYTGSRGFDRPSSFNNNLVLINGHVLNELIYGSQSLDNYLGIDMDDISRVEIIQGPSSTLYGSGAMVSVINIILKDAKELDGLKAGIRYGTYDNKYTHLNFGKTFGDFSISLTGRYGDKGGNDFFFEKFKDTNSDGFTRNLDWEKHYASTLQAKYKDFSLNFYYANREKAIPNAPYDADFNTGTNESIDKRYFVNLLYNKEINSDKVIKARLFYDAYEYWDVFYYDSEPEYDKSNGIWFGTEIEFTWDINPQNRIFFGTNITSVSKAVSLYYNNIEVFNETDIPFTFGSVFIQDNYQIVNNLALNIGIRADFISYYTPNFNPRLAIIYNTSQNTTLKYILNSGFRTPSIYELFAGEQDFKVVDTGLRPESILSNEIIWDNLISDEFNYSISVYHNKFSNVIDFAFKNNENPDSGYVFKNIPNISAFGIEASFRGKVDFGLNWYFNLTFQRTLDSLNNQISNSPQIMVKGGVGINLIEDFSISLESKYESNRKTVYNENTDEYYILDANINYIPVINNSNSIFHFLNNLQLSLRIKNLFDKIYYLPGPYWISTNSIEQYGRILTFSLSARI
jgi:iron complex outermembrane receptor protein